MGMDLGQPHQTDCENTTQRFAIVQELGDCYASTDQLEEARQCYEKAAVLGPDEPDPYIGLGVIALQADRLEDAEIAFRVACRLDPQSARAYAGQAMVAQQRSDYTRAFDLYLKCLELDTDNPTALLGLFQTSCQMKSFGKIIYYLKLYLDMHPGDTAVMFSLAALYAKEGSPEEAETQLKDLLALEPTNQDAANLLEEVEHTLKRQQQAASRAIPQ